jgi:hypothetical protein
MKRQYLLLVICFSIVYSNPCYCSPEFQVQSSFTPVGSGARAIGKGGAFLAVADDATAASWNPGALIRVKRSPEFILVLSAYVQTENTDFGDKPEASGVYHFSKYDINFLGVTYPFHIFDRNMVFSVTYQKRYDFNRAWNFTFTEKDKYSICENDYEFKQYGRLAAIGISLCFQLNRTISAGLTVNLWNDYITDNHWIKETKIFGNGLLGQNKYRMFTNDKQFFALRGINYHLGILWKMTPKFAFGAVVKTKLIADLNCKENHQTLTIFHDYPDANTDDQYDIQWKGSMHLPLTTGVGLSYKFTDCFTLVRIH